MDRLELALRILRDLIPPNGDSVTRQELPEVKEDDLPYSPLEVFSAVADYLSAIMGVPALRRQLLELSGPNAQEIMYTLQVVCHSPDASSFGCSDTPR